MSYFQLRHCESLDEAEKGIAKAQSLAADDVNLMYINGWLLAVHKREASGLAMLEELARQEVFNRNPVFLDQLGDAYQALDRGAEAQSVWARALKAFPATTAPADRRKAKLITKLQDAPKD